MGKFKGETNSLPITAFAALNPTCNYFNHLNKNDTINNTKKPKGVATAIVKHEIKHGDYMHIMNTNDQLSRGVVSLRSQDHMIRMIKNRFNCAE